MTYFSLDAEDSRQLGYSADFAGSCQVKHLDTAFIVTVNSILSCEHMWFSWEQKSKILVCIHIFIATVYIKLKSHRDMTNITETTKILLNFSTSHTKQIQIQIGGKFLLLSRAQILAHLTFLTIVLALNTFLKHTGWQSEQIIAPRLLLWRRSTEVLNTCVTFLLYTIVTGVNYPVGRLVQYKQSI